ncbi:MAG: hypothetical protein RIQ81_1884 [Pseudomonadota bacterium]|jgi:hypothetical protein
MNFMKQSKAINSLRRLWQRPLMTATTYYFLSWQALIVSTLLMTAVSHAVTNTALILSIATCFATLLIYRRLSIRTVAQARLAGYIVSGLIVVWAFTGERENKDIASVAMEVLLAALPALLQDMSKEKRIFGAITVANVIAIGSIMLSDNLNSYVTFLLFILAMTTTLNATRMYFLSRNAADASEQLPVNFFYQLLRVIPLGIIFGSTIFYWFPRMNDMALDIDVAGFKNRTGYNSEVNLGTKGAIEASNRINLWISSRTPDWLERNANSIYIRGTSLDRFDGISWKNTGSPQNLASVARDLRISKAHSRGMIDLTVFREPGPSKDIFYPHGLWQLDVPNRLIQEVFVDEFGNIARTQEGSFRFQYDLKVSQLIPNTSDGISQSVSDYRRTIAGLPATVDFYYQLSARQAQTLLEVPSNISTSTWFNEFVSEIDSSLGGNRSATTVGQLLRHIQRFFRQNYKASLKVEFTGQDNLKDFLSGGKEGHCELFATATALYLRNAGIPVRLVAGYMGGHFNLMSQMLEVPEKNAHVWLEIFHPQYGWVNYDPTPIILANQSSQLADNMTMIRNAFKFWFTRYVIDYDARAQKELVVTVSRIDMSKLMEFDKVSLDRDTGELVALAVLLLIALWLLFRVVTRDDNLPDAPGYYRALSKRLLRLGYSRKAGESYLEYHKRLWDEGLNSELLLAAHNALERDLYGRQKLSRTEQNALKKALKRLPVRPKNKPGKNTQPTAQDPQSDPSQQQAHG